MTSTEHLWTAYPNAAEGERSAAGSIDQTGPVVGLGARCELREGQAEGALASSFLVSEFVRLQDGQIVVLHEDRGFTLGAVGGATAQDGSTARLLTQNVLNVVLPDDDNGEDHPWPRLVQLAGQRGVTVTIDELRAMPYEVILSDDVIGWLAESGEV